MVFPFGNRGSSRPLIRSKSVDKLITLPSVDTTSHPADVLLIGQIYLDTILDVDHFPDEDHKLRALCMEQRRGGNIGNTSEILAQFPSIRPYIMSAIGPKELSRQLIAQLETKGIKTSTCIFRKTPTPSSYIIKSRATGSRTIISCTTMEDISRDEFSRKFEMASLTKTLSFESDGKAPFRWIHFEGRNVDQAVQQIDWVDEKAQREGWRTSLTISVELEKPDREHIDWFMAKGDVIFFSKLFAEHRGYSHPADFLRAIRSQCKQQATLYCTWGALGATCLQPNGEEIHASAPLLSQVKDTIGAGDTFIGGIIVTLLRGMSHMSSLKFACELATRKVAQQGFDGLADAMANNSRLWDPHPVLHRKTSMVRKYSDSDVVHRKNEDEYDDDDTRNGNDQFSSLSFTSSEPFL
ncbi:Ribokinase-like protein [Phascolomyces articulosus]|uniref:Ribokinase-like protein n=1 Tax=Phascolomyces articulosus TaxID=60185 RepID=A0AAD5K0M3_9FUNG|nr:Ribokinase-like protein [Phascolomyces articulosus]